MGKVTSLKKEIIREYRGASRGSAAGNTNPPWRGTPASAPPMLLEEKAGLGLRPRRSGRWTLDLFDARAGGAVGGRFGDSHLAVHGAGLAMDLAARPDHGGDPRPLRLPLLGARGGGSGHVGDRTAKTEQIKSPAMKSFYGSFSN